MIILYLVIRLVCQLLTFAIILRAVLSWFPISSHNFVVVILNKITEPILAPIRRIVPRLAMLDLSPLIAIVVLQLIYRLVP